MDNSSSRPSGIVVIAFVLAVNGVLALVSAFGVLGEDPITVVAMVLDVVFGVAMLGMAYSVWALRPWAWVGTIAIAGANALFSLYLLFAAPGVFTVWLNVVLSAGLTIYLLNPEVKAAFEHGSVRA